MLFGMYTFKQVSIAGFYIFIWSSLPEQLMSQKQKVEQKL